MAAEGVLLTYDYFENKEKRSAAASGIKFNNFVITHGSFLSSIKQIQSLLTTNENIKKYKKLPKVIILGEKSMEDNSIFKMVEDSSRSRDLNFEHPSYKIKVYTGRIRKIWRCPAIKKCVDNLFHSWTVAHKDATFEDQGTLGKDLLSVFVLIELDHTDIKDSNPLMQLMQQVTLPPGRGAGVELHATPFGCEVFLNSVTRGYVCNAVGEGPAILLSDASSALGCEGGPVFLQGTRNLVGMIINSVSWWRAEWVGLTMVAPLATVLGQLLQNNKPIEKPLSEDRRSSILAAIDACTLLVRCGSAWGAGVYVDSGWILTAAHVIIHHNIYKVYIYNNGVKQQAKVCYKTTDDKPYDLAILHTDPKELQHMIPAEFDEKPAEKGEQVLAAGYPFFTESDIKCISPTVTSGHVANVSPTMVQTTCCIQSGFSGGPIFRITDYKPKVLGITVSNARVENGSCYPHVNMAVPNHVYVHAVKLYIHSLDNCKLASLESDREVIQSQWKLLPYKSKL